MDKSETFIKQCEKSEEIQSQVIPRPFDGNIYVEGHRLNWRESHKCLIWLPRQDQLQEMVLTSETPMFAIGTLNAWIEVFKPNVSSMEQLWLAFVMQEKFNKIWDGEKWISKN